MLIADNVYNGSFTKGCFQRTSHVLKNHFTVTKTHLVGHQGHSQQQSDWEKGFLGLYLDTAGLPKERKAVFP